MKKVSTTVYLDSEQFEKLKHLNRETKVPVAQFVRDGVRIVIEREFEKLEKLKALSGEKIENEVCATSL